LQVGLLLGNVQISYDGFLVILDPLPHMTALWRFEQTSFAPEASYDIWTFPNSRPTCNSVQHLQIVTLCKIQKEKSSNLPMVC